MTNGPEGGAMEGLKRRHIFYQSNTSHSRRNLSNIINFPSDIIYNFVIDEADSTNFYAVTNGALYQNAITDA